MRGLGLLPTREAHLSLSVHSFYWGLVTQTWLTLVSGHLRGQCDSTWPRAPTTHLTVIIDWPDQSPPGKQRHSYQARHAKGLEVTSQELNTKDQTPSLVKVSLSLCRPAPSSLPRLFYSKMIIFVQVSTFSIAFIQHTAIASVWKCLIHLEEPLWWRERVKEIMNPSCKAIAYISIWSSSHLWLFVPFDKSCTTSKHRNWLMVS